MDFLQLKPVEAFSSNGNSFATVNIFWSKAFKQKFQQLFD